MLLTAALMTIASSQLTTRDLIELVDLSGVAASPDGQWVAFRIERPSVERNHIDLQWAIVPTDGSAPARIIAEGGIATSNGAGVLDDEKPIWDPHGRALIYRARIDGRSQLRRTDITTGKSRPLGDREGDVLQATRSPDGTSLVVSVAPSRLIARAREAELIDQGVRLDTTVGLSVGVIGGSDRGAGEETVRMTGDWFDRGRSWLPERRYRLDISSGRLSETLPADDIDITGAQSLAKTSAAVCKKMSCANRRVATAVALPGDATLITTVNSDFGQTLSVIEGDTARTLVQSGGQLSGSRYRATPCAATRSAAICVAADAAAPPRLVLIDLATGETRTLFDPNAALAARLPARVRRLSWRDRRGRPFNGVLFLPQGSAARPALPLVIQYYACEGFIRGGVGDELPYQLLAQRGIAALCINKPRRSTGGRNALQDYRTARSGIEAIVQSLTKAGTIDPARIGMHGLSFGSEITTWMWTRSSLLRAAAIASGQLEPSIYWFEALPGRDTPDQLREGWGLGNPDAREQWRRLAPVASLARAEAPMLMQLPESEARWSIELLTRLARSGKAVDTFIYPLAAHVKFLPRQRLSAAQRTLNWFAFWLAPERRSKRDDAKSIATWRAIEAQSDQRHDVPGP